MDSDRVRQPADVAADCAPEPVRNLPLRRGARARVGFLGVEGIGRSRLEAILRDGAVEVVALADPSPSALEEAVRLAPGAAVGMDLDGLLAHGVQGVVIATPSALHAAQCLRALEAGVAVFCQRPLGVCGVEAAAVVAAARRANRLLGVDLLYRCTSATERVQALIAEGALGEVYAAELCFHDARGPDTPWFYDPRLSGGGCVMDLGVHLVDLALWCLGFPEVRSVRSALFAGGAPLRDRRVQVEDFAMAELTLGTGAHVRLACSWKLHGGENAVFEASFQGSRGGLAVRSADGAFYALTAERHPDSARPLPGASSEPWAARAAVRWARRVAGGARFDEQAAELVAVSRVTDRIYDA